jgi:hypothetical protein
MAPGCRRVALLVAISMAFAVKSATATTLAFTPPSQTKLPGAFATVAITIVDPPAQGIGAFDLAVVFDPDITGLAAISETQHLGVTFGLITDISVPGIVRLADVSLESSADLLALQPHDDFELLTLTFTALTDGTGHLSLGSVLLADAEGDQILNVTLEEASIIVGRGPIGVAAPSTLLLLGLGLAGAVCARRAKHRPHRRSTHGPQRPRAEAMRLICGPSATIPFLDNHETNSVK